jgi:anaerobic magnesium-protoporphyrin IX monomethyl ester cyclase
MRIHLINAPMRKCKRVGGEIVSTMWPPYALMCLSAYLSKKWQEEMGPETLPEITITDGVLKGAEATSQRMLEFKPDIIGITFLTPNATGAYDLINEIRDALPGALIVCGGVHASALPEEVLERSGTDLVVCGEGEQTFYEIVRTRFEGADKPEEIHGTVYRKEGGLVRAEIRKPVPIDDLPLPGYDYLEEVEAYKGFRFKKKSREMFVMSTRGCPFDCCFCSNVVWKMCKPHFRTRSPEKFVDQLENFVKRYGVQEFFDMADEFNCNLRWAHKVCDEIIRRDLKIYWKCQLRVDKVTDDLARTLKKAGCWYVHIGAETGNQRTLDGIGKKVSLAQIEESCKILRRHGIRINALFMLYNIWEKEGKLQFENLEENLRTLDFAGRLLRQDLATNIGMTITTPYPGSRLYGIARRHGIIKDGMVGHWEKWNQVWSISVNLPGVTEADITRLKAAAGRLQARYLYKMLFMINFRNLRQLFLAKGWGLFKVQLNLFARAVKGRFSRQW